MTNRRAFIRWGVIGFVLSRIFPRQSSVFAQSKSYPMGTIEQLDAQGFLFNEDLDIGAVYVKRKKDNLIMAIDPTCTHAGCIVEWKEDKNSFLCPCHQSLFEEDGTVIEGLASSDLPQYEVTIQEQTIFVSSK